MKQLNTAERKAIASKIPEVLNARFSVALKLGENLSEYIDGRDLSLNANDIRRVVWMGGVLPSKKNKIIFSTLDRFHYNGFRGSEDEI